MSHMKKASVLGGDRIVPPDAMAGMLSRDAIDGSNFLDWLAEVYALTSDGDRAIAELTRLGRRPAALRHWGGASTRPSIPGSAARAARRSAVIRRTARRWLEASCRMA